MKIPDIRRPSAAMLVASTALVSSLTGPAVADEVAQMAQKITSSKQIKNGTVTGADIKNGSVSSADISNNSVNATDILDGGIRTEDIGTGQVTTHDLAPDSVRGDKIQSDTIGGSDIIDGSLTGREIDESTLATVPSAANADKLDGKDSDDFASASRLQPFAAGMTLGQTGVVLARAGTLTLLADCEDDGGGTAELRLYVKTSAPNALLDGSDSRTGGVDPATSPDSYLQPTTSPEDSEIESSTSSSTFPASNSDIDEGYAVGQDGSYIGLDAEALAQTFNVNGSRCYTAGTAFTAAP